MSELPAPGAVDREDSTRLGCRVADLQHRGGRGVRGFQLLPNQPSSSRSLSIRNPSIPGLLAGCRRVPPHLYLKTTSGVTRRSGRRNHRGTRSDRPDDAHRGAPPSGVMARTHLPQRNRAFAWQQARLWLEWPHRPSMSRFRPSRPPVRDHLRRSRPHLGGRSAHSAGSGHRSHGLGVGDTAVHAVVGPGDAADEHVRRHAHGEPGRRRHRAAVNSLFYGRVPVTCQLPLAYVIAPFSSPLRQAGAANRAGPWARFHELTDTTASDRSNSASAGNIAKSGISLFAASPATASESPLPMATRNA
jgi:hypothetical protein